MNKTAVLKHFGGPAATARALGVSHQAISQWGSVIPERMAHRAATASKGRLKVDEWVYRRKAS